MNPTLRKWFPFALILVAPGISAGQSLLPSQQAEQDILTAYGTLATNTGIRFDISGWQIDATGSNQTTTPIGGELYYRSTTDSTGRLNINIDLYETVNGVATYELIADGRTMWVYRPALQPTASNQGTYSASAYDYPASASTGQNPNYLHDLMTGLPLAVPASGRGSYAVRLVRELYSNAAGPVYHSWIPMPINVGPVEIAYPPSYQDPITGWFVNPATGTEQPTSPTTLPETWWTIYNSAPSRAIAFEMTTTSNNGPNTIQRIYYTDRQTFGARTRTTFWTITPVAITDFSLANFAPYAATRLRGWRPIIGPQISHL